MNPLRQMLHDQLAQALGCTSADEYSRNKAAILDYLRRTQPQNFMVEGARRRAFEHMARVEGITVDEKIEDLALTGYLVHRSFNQIPKAEALAAVASCGLPENERPLVEKILNEIYSGAVPTTL
jgi:hypothetical protein